MSALLSVLLAPLLVLRCLLARCAPLLLALMIGGCQTDFAPLRSDVEREPAARQAQATRSSALQELVAYSRERGGIDLWISQRGKPLRALDKESGAAPIAPLASGSKSFWGVAAAAAIDDGLIRDWDEPVADTLESWRDDPLKSRVTVRQLLNFTSGLAAGTKQLRGSASVDKFATAVHDIPMVAEPGTRFTYGPSHLSVFGAFLEGKLRAAGREPDPLAYLQTRILEPIGLNSERWNRDMAGHPIMAAGASMSAAEWGKFGQFIANQGRIGKRQLVSGEQLQALFKGSTANPAYGLTFWLNRGPGIGPGAAGGGAARAARRGQKEFSAPGSSAAMPPRELVAYLRQQERAGLLSEIPAEILIANTDKLQRFADRLEQKAGSRGTAAEQRAGRRAEQLRELVERGRSFSGAAVSSTSLGQGVIRHARARRHLFPGGPPSLIMAAGSGNQRLYIFPEQKWVIARLGRRSKDWQDEEFLERVQQVLDGL